MCKTALEKHFDDDNFYCDIYFYKANTINLDNIEYKISPFKLHDVTGYISLYYCLTKEFKQE